MAVALAATLFATAGIAGAAHADSSAALNVPPLSDGTWADVPDPGAKAGSPATMLDSRPKFTERQLAQMRA